MKKPPVCGELDWQQPSRAEGILCAKNGRHVSHRQGVAPCWPCAGQGLELCHHGLQGVPSGPARRLASMTCLIGRGLQRLRNFWERGIVMSPTDKGQPPADSVLAGTTRPTFRGAMGPVRGCKVVSFGTEAGAWACSWRGAPNQTIIEDLAAQESKAERSLMHRFNIGLVSSAPAFSSSQLLSHPLQQALTH